MPPRGKLQEPRFATCRQRTITVESNKYLNVDEKNEG